MRGRSRRARARSGPRSASETSAARARSASPTDRENPPRVPAPASLRRRVQHGLRNRIRTQAPFVENSLVGTIGDHGGELLRDDFAERRIILAEHDALIAGGQLFAN